MKGIKPTQEQLKEIEGLNIITGIDPDTIEVEGQTNQIMATCHLCGKANTYYEVIKWFQCWNCGSPNYIK